jgi:hypothetical protein
VIAYLPNEKLAAYADMFNWPSAQQPVPDPPVVGSQVFLRTIERLGLDVSAGILSVHTMNPDRLVKVEEIRASLGSNKL